MLNCPNCGAPVDVELNKCAYCGTSYFDISSIPLHEPFWLRLNVGTKEKPEIIVQKVFTTGITIESHPEFCSYADMSGCTIKRLLTNNQQTYELSLVSVN